MTNACSDLVLQIVSMLAATVQAVALAYISYRYGRKTGKEDAEL